MIPDPAIFGLTACVEEHLTRVSERSLPEYLGKVVIASEPTPQPWENIIEPWQIEHLVKPLVPAIESVAGIRPDYDGKRDFWIELPKGHDKTSFIGRLVNWIIGFSPKRLFGSIGASSVEQAARLVERATEESHLNPWLRRRVSYALKVMRGPGGTFQVISSDAPKSSGRTDDIVICDELTFWESEALWNQLRAGRIKRGLQVFVVITNAGTIGTWQWEKREIARTSDRWHFFSSPVGEFLATWMNQDAIAALKREVNPLMRRRVILNEWVSATENPILTEDLIDPCINKRVAWKRGKMPENYRPGTLFIGMDVGRKNDLSAIVLFELLGERVILRHIHTMRDVEFVDQRKALYGLIDMHRQHLKKVKIDRGFNPEIAERAERDYPGLCEGISMGQVWQGRLAGRILDLFETRRIEIPRDDELRSDLQRVEQVGITKGGQPIVKSERDKTGHADRFWAMAAALDGMPDRQKKISSVGPRGFNRRKSNQVARVG